MVYVFQPNELLSAKIQSLCPSISGNVCCTETQFETLRAQVQQVRMCYMILFIIVICVVAWLGGSNELMFSSDQAYIFGLRYVHLTNCLVLFFCNYVL